LKINKFKPDLVLFSNRVKISDFYRYMGGRRVYKFANGKSAIIAALKVWGVSNKNILVPYYICNDVIEAIICSGNSAIYCDIDKSDLNISYESVVEMCAKHTVEVVLAPSLYGSPARIDAIEKFCKEEHIYLLNDCAQSIGSLLHGKQITTYGDAAVTSLSPGKPLSGFSGGYLSINADLKNFYVDNYGVYYICICATYLFSRLWIDFVITRVFGRILNSLCNKYGTYSLADISKFQLPAWVHNYNMKFFFFLKNGKLQYKSEFVGKLPKSNYYRIILSARGKSITYMLVMVFNTSELASDFKKYISEKKIYHSTGYDLNKYFFDSAKSLVNKVVNLPIDPCRSKRDYLFKSIASWNSKQI
jgi:hypothetical protein